MNVEGNKKITITWFPPSWLLIKTKDKIIYVDPAWIQKNFNSYPNKKIYSHYPEPMDGLPEKDLPKADVILITHHHKDHIKTATINRLSTAKTEIYATKRCAKLVGRKYTEVKPGDKFDLGWLKVSVVFAYNTVEGHSTRKVHHKGECVGYVLTINGKTIYHAGDTDVIQEMNELGKINVALLPVGGTFTMNTEEALQAIKQIKPMYFTPLHYLHQSQEKVKNAILKANVESIIKVLCIGEKLEMS